MIISYYNMEFDIVGMHLIKLDINRKIYIYSEIKVFSLKKGFKFHLKFFSRIQNYMLPLIHMNAS